MAKNELFKAALGLPLFLFVVGPVLISEFMGGGWTKKYTANPTGLTLTSMPKLNAKVAIVTGATSGIGYETAKGLLFAGAEVIITARTQAKGEAAVARLVEEVAEAFPSATEVRIRSMVCDQSSLKGVRNFVNKFSDLGIPLHILVLNAGVMKSPGPKFMGKNYTFGFGMTADGFEQHIGVNHIAHQYMVKLLTRSLKADPPSRVVSVTSVSNGEAYHPEGIRPETWKVVGAEEENLPPWYEDGTSYGQSKLANILFAKEYARKMQGTGITSYSAHPGLVQTNLFRDLEAKMISDGETASWIEGVFSAIFRVVMTNSLMSTADGALTQLFLASAPSEKLVNGGYYLPIGVLTDPSHPQGTNATLQEQLWRETDDAIAWALKNEEEVEVEHEQQLASAA